MPVPTTRAVGVANPSAHGQAMTRVETSTSMLCSTGAPERYHPMAAATAITMTTGTKTREIRSTKRWIGAFPPCAASTKAMTRSRRVAPAASVTRTMTVASTGLDPP